MLGLYPPMPVLYCMVALLDCCAFCAVECGAAAAQPILYSGGLFVNKLVLHMLYSSDGCLPDPSDVCMHSVWKCDTCHMVM